MTTIVAAVLAGLVVVLSSAGMVLAQATGAPGGSSAQPGVQNTPQPGGAEGAMDIQSAQAKLQQAGFNPGPANGILTEETRTAIRQFQQSKGLPETGDLDQTTRSALLDPASGAKPQGTP